MTLEVPELEPDSTEDIVEAAEDLGEEIADVVEDAVEDAPETEVDVTVIEAVEPPETSFVDVGDLHISGPPEMVERVTKDYLKNHIDHNPHDTEHGGDEGLVEAATPDVVEDVIAEQASGETHDAPPDPADWLFRNRGGE